jgi:Zn-dependent M32 family carboxypeptidase
MSSGFCRIYAETIHDYPVITVIPSEKSDLEQEVEPMAEQQNPPNPVGDEFIKLGENLRDIFTSAWESEERKKVSEDVKTGLNQLVTTFTKLADEFSQSETGQSIQAELDEFQSRVRAGDVQTKIAQDVLNVLQMMNRELSKVSEKWSSQSPGSPLDKDVDSSS